MPSPLIMHRIKMPNDKPCKCDDCPLYGHLPEEWKRKNSKYNRICILTSEYLSNRAGHLKVGNYCPMRKQSEKLTLRTWRYVTEQAKPLVYYKPNIVLEFPKVMCETFGLIHDPVQGELKLKQVLT